jgi:hypothetical protein
MSGLGLLAGIGTSLYGANQAKKAQSAANRANLAALQRGRSEILKGRDAYMSQSGKGLAYYLDALEEAGIAEGRAAGELSRGTTAAARGIADQDRQAMGALGGSFASRGLFGSTLMDQARTGVRRSTARSLTDLEGSSAMARAQLARGAGAARMGALSQLGGFEERRAGTLFDTGRALAGLETGVQHVADPGIASSYGQLGGMLAGGLDSLGGGLSGLWSRFFGGGAEPGYTNEEDGGA